VPVRSDGTIDDQELTIVEGIAAWMDVNQEAIFGTRPWKIFGEGPASAGAALSAQGFNEGKGKPFTAEDVRYTAKGDALYAIVPGRPTSTVTLKSLGATAARLDREIASVERLGASAPLRWTRAPDALQIEPGDIPSDAHTVVFKIRLR
jgi:alpha-L-fucosidase